MEQDSIPLHALELQGNYIFECAHKLLIEPVEKWTSAIKVCNIWLWKERKWQNGKEGQHQKRDCIFFRIFSNTIWNQVLSWVYIHRIIGHLDNHISSISNPLPLLEKGNMRIKPELLCTCLPHTTLLSHLTFESRTGAFHHIQISRTSLATFAVHLKCIQDVIHYFEDFSTHSTFVASQVPVELFLHVSHACIHLCIQIRIPSGSEGWLLACDGHLSAMFLHANWLGWQEYSNINSKSFWRDFMGTGHLNWLYTFENPIRNIFSPSASL